MQTRLNETYWVVKRTMMTDSLPPEETESGGTAKPAKSARRSRRGRGALLFFRDLLIIIVLALGVSWVVKTYLVRSFYIPSPSMENTLQVDDRILVEQLT